MTASQLIFYLIAAFILSTAILAVTTRRLFRSAIWLLLCLVGVAGLYFWMEVNFIAAVQIIVYAGGIVVLIIFSIFLTQQAGKSLPAPVTSRWMLSLLAVLAGFVFTCILLNKTSFSTGMVAELNTDPAVIGTQMLSTTEHGYVLPFEVVSLLLLAAMVGCIVIAKKQTVK